jgi:asparagine synthase (glutamine-hydrolysing)
VLHWGHDTTPRIHEPHQSDIISSRFVLGHNRLAILAPTPRAAQPMRSRTTNTWITFNGEIYNFKELRERFSRHFPWRTNADSEVLLKSVDLFGSDIIPHLNGMFAFATLDAQAETLVEARDRLGIKPLYCYHIPGRVFAIASEIKAFLAFGLFQARLNERSLREYLTFQNSLSGETLLEGVSEFPAGSYARVDLRKGTMTLSRYWAPPRFTPTFSSLESAAEATTETLSRVVERQLVAEVPVGSFFGGGLDSSAVTSFASARRSQLPSFTCGFEIDPSDSEGALCDETAAANSIAMALTTNHHLLRLDMTSWSQTLPS